MFTGEVDDDLGKGVVFQLELKDRQYTLRAGTEKEAKRWVDVLTALRDGGTVSTDSTHSSSALSKLHQQHQSAATADRSAASHEAESSPAAAQWEKKSGRIFCCCTS